MRWRLATTVPAVVAGALTVRLLAAFQRSDFSYRLVAEQSRADSAWYYRLAGAWASAEGSLLVLTGIVAVVGLVGTWRDGAAARVAAAVTTGLLAIVAGAAWPFDRSLVPATRGLGLTPILEHPAMAVHPPLLYVGFAATVVPFARAVSGRLGDPGRDRRWRQGSLAALTLAITLGAFWSYAEQGWGGYWAWDPVENSSFAVWLALVAAVHLAADPSPRRRPDRTARVVAGAPWCVVLAASAASRSGAVPSVHAFAEAATVGWSLAAATVVSGLALAVPMLRPPTVPTRAATSTAATSTIATSTTAANGAPNVPVDLGPPLRSQVALTIGAFAVVAIGILVPFLARAAGTELVVTGRFYARILLPVAVVALGLLAWVALDPARRVALPGRAWIAHAAVALVVVGVLASTRDHVTSVGLARDETVVVLGLEVTNHGVTVEPGTRPGSQVVRADLEVDGRRLSPSLVTAPERGGVLSETALRSGLRRDVRVGLIRADDAGRVVIEVRTRPGMVLVWTGALALAGSAGLRRRRRSRPGVRRPNGVPASAPAGP